MCLSGHIGVLIIFLSSIFHFLKICYPFLVFHLPPCEIWSYIFHLLKVSSYPYLTFGVDRLLHLSLTEVVSARPTAQLVVIIYCSFLVFHSPVLHFQLTPKNLNLSLCWHFVIKESTLRAGTGMMMLDRGARVATDRRQLSLTIDPRDPTELPTKLNPLKLLHINYLCFLLAHMDFCLINLLTSLVDSTFYCAIYV